MEYRIVHQTRFEYEEPAYDSHNELRLRPLDGPGQRCTAFELELDQPASVLEYQDFFGNYAHSVSVREPHRLLTFVTRSVVESQPLAANIVEQNFAEFLRHDSRRRQTHCEYLEPSLYTPFSPRLEKFFWMIHPESSDDVAGYVMRISNYVRDQFEYETKLTHVHSSLDDILKSGGGVCQDFAHLTIGLLRLAGVPARYVSGYLAPDAVAKPAVTVGDQASHAWFEAWLPGNEWCGFDPTHSCRTDERYVRIAIGRDYNDVTPLRGVYHSGGISQSMTVDLRVEPAASASPDRTIDPERRNGLQNQQ